eukprot:4162118-Prymnesium_polylepis.1
MMRAGKAMSAGCARYCVSRKCGATPSSISRPKSESERPRASASLRRGRGPVGGLRIARWARGEGGKLQWRGASARTVEGDSSNCGGRELERQRPVARTVEGDRSNGGCDSSNGHAPHRDWMDGGSWQWSPTRTSRSQPRATIGTMHDGSVACQALKERAGQAVAEATRAQAQA